MKLHDEILKKLVEKGTRAWTDLELGIANKTKVLKQIHSRLALFAEPAEENNVKIEIIRQSCQFIKNTYPVYAKEADLIINRFEHHLKFDNMAVLPFKQIDALTYRIFLKENLYACTG